MKTITREEIKMHLDNRDQMTLIEALPEQSFSEGHLPGAQNIQQDKVRELAPKLLKNKIIKGSTGGQKSILKN